MVNERCILIPAAGASTRLGYSKQLAEFAGESLIRRAVKASLSVCENVVVVLGDLAEEISAEIADLPVVVSVNEDWRKGMGSSISCGIKAAKENYPQIKGILIHLSDLPLIDATHLSSLLEKSETEAEKIVYSVYDNFGGVPAYFPETWFDKLVSLDSDSGAQNILKSARDSEKTGIELGLEYFDVDGPADYAKLLELEKDV